jgi:hypothetical protein
VSGRHPERHGQRDGRPALEPQRHRAQVWAVHGNGLVNPQSNRCLDVTGANSADGTRLGIWDCTGAANQQWSLP